MKTKTLRIANNSKNRLVLESIHKVHFWIILLLIPIAIFVLSLTLTILTEGLVFSFVGIPLSIASRDFLKHWALDTIVFDNKLITVNYQKPYGNSTETYSLSDSDLDLFIEIGDKEVMIEVGLESKVIMVFNLNDVLDLPLLTTSVAKLANLELLKSKTIERKEVLRFSNKKQLSQKNPKMDYFEITRITDKLSVIIGKNRFWIDYNKNKLCFHEWHKVVEIDLNQISSIRYAAKVDEKNRLITFDYLLKNATAYKTIVNIDERIEGNFKTYYTNFAYQKEIQQVVKRLKSEPTLKHIKFIER